MITLRAAVLILTLVRVSLVEGIETSKPAENRTEISSESPRRILYGSRVRGREFPHLVGLGLAVSLCGGAIIANHWILTAAHCIFGEICTKIKIFPSAWKKPQSTYPAQCFMHERFRTRNYEYDIGLLKVNADLVQDGRAKIIKLPLPGQVEPIGTEVTIAGWGTTEDDQISSALKRAKVRIDKWETCNTQFLALAEPGARGIPKRMLCLQGYGRNPGGTCYGDSGGPAITSDGVVIGVSTFGLIKDGKCLLGGPSMFLRVVDYLPWIYRFIEPHRDTSRYPVTPERF